VQVKTGAFPVIAANHTIGPTKVDWRDGAISAKHIQTVRDRVPDVP
jgi:hypothetical protein